MCASEPKAEGLMGESGKKGKSGVSSFLCHAGLSLRRQAPKHVTRFVRCQKPGERRPTPESARYLDSKNGCRQDFFHGISKNIFLGRILLSLAIPFKGSSCNPPHRLVMPLLWPSKPSPSCEITIGICYKKTIAKAAARRPMGLTCPCHLHHEPAGHSERQRRGAAAAGGARSAASRLHASANRPRTWHHRIGGRTRSRKMAALRGGRETRHADRPVPATPQPLGPGPRVGPSRLPAETDRCRNGPGRLDHLPRFGRAGRPGTRGRPRLQAPVNRQTEASAAANSPAPQDGPHPGADCRRVGLKPQHGGP